MRGNRGQKKNASSLYLGKGTKAAHGSLGITPVEFDDDQETSIPFTAR